MKKSEQERLAIVETKVTNIESDVHEIKDDVKKLLYNNAHHKGGMTLFWKVVTPILGGLMGFIAGMLGHK